MPDHTAHPDELTRLQATLTALQDLLAANPEEIVPFHRAQQMAAIAVEIALGQRHEVPQHLVRN